MTDYHRIRISVPGPLGREGEVYLDDMALKGVKDVALYVGVDRVNEAVITLAVDAVEADVMVSPTYIEGSVHATRFETPIEEGSETPEHG